MISRQPDTTIVGAKFSLISTSPPRVSYLAAFEVALRTGGLTQETILGLSRYLHH